MRRTFCIALVAAFAAASAHADIHKVKPADRRPIPHAGMRPGNEPGVKDLFADCAALIAAGRAKAMIPQIWTDRIQAETCAGASAPAQSPPAGSHRRINGPSIVAGPGACSVIGEVGRSC